METKKLSGEELEAAVGGAGVPREVYNLNNFVYRKVSVPPGTLLVMQDRPGGGFLTTSYQDGEPIYVNPHYSEAGYLIAYKYGEYGYVDAKYVK